MAAVITFEHIFMITTERVRSKLRGLFSLPWLHRIHHFMHYTFEIKQKHTGCSENAVFEWAIIFQHSSDFFYVECEKVENSKKLIITLKYIFEL